MKTLLKALFLSIIAGSPAFAQSFTIEQAYKAMLAINERQCADGKDSVERLKKEGKFPAAEIERLGTEETCECKTKKIISALSSRRKTELDKYVSLDEFRGIYMSEISETCSAQHLRAMYSKPSCQIIYAKLEVGPDKYCACMIDGLAAFSAAEAVIIGIDPIDYMLDAAAAEKQGLPIPDKSPIISRFIALQNSCK